MSADPARVAEAVALIAAAKRPLFYGGGGLINSGPAACARFTELVRLVDAPCTLTLMGLGALPASDPQRCAAQSKTPAAAIEAACRLAPHGS